MTDTDRIAQMAREAGLPAQVTSHPAFKQFVKEHARLVADDFVEFVQSYPHWLGPEAKREMIEAIRSRYK